MNTDKVAKAIVSTLFGVIGIVGWAYWGRHMGFGFWDGVAGYAVVTFLANNAVTSHMFNDKYHKVLR